MNEEKRYSLSEVKEIIKKESAELISKEDLDVNFMVFTEDEYLASDYYQELVKKYSKKEADDFVNTGACIVGKSDVIVFIKQSNKVEFDYSGKDITLLLWKFFHEIRHVMQKDYKYNNDIIEYMLCVFCDVLNNYARNFYYEKYDDLFIEVDANVYGLNKTIEVLEKYPNIKNDSNKLLMKTKKLWDIIYQTYDYNVVFNEFFDVVRKDNRLGYSFLLSNDDEVKKFHKSTIICDKFKEKNKPESAYKILASDVYLKNLDYSSLTSEEVKIMLDAVERIIEDWINKNEYLKQVLANKDANIYQCYLEFLINRHKNIDKRLEFLDETFNKLKKIDKSK